MPVHPGFQFTSTGCITIYFQNGMDRHFVDQVVTYAQTAFENDRAFWGDPPGGMQPISIYLCSSRSRWFQLGLSSDGNALTAGSSILLYPSGIGPRYLPAIIGVEMSHAFAAQHIGNIGFSKLPCWAEEGLATHLGAPAWSSETQMNAYSKNNGSQDLVFVSTLNSRIQWTNAYESNPPVTLMYGHARGLVEYLIRHYGIGRFKDFLHQVSFVRKSSEVFLSVYKIDLAQADREWLAEAKSLNHVPQNTKLVSIPISWFTVVNTTLPYVVISFVGLWLIRQFFWLGRKAMTGFRMRHPIELSA